MNILLHGWDIQKIKCAPMHTSVSLPNACAILLFNGILCKNTSANTPGFHFYNSIEYKSE